MNMNTVIGVEEAAAELGVTGARVRQLLSGGRIIGARKISRAWVIPSPVRVLTARQAAKEQA